MSSLNQPGTEINRRVAALREFLQQERSRPRVAPLVASLIARNVETHQKMLTDLGNQLRKMEDGLSSESEHASRISERVHDIEQDAKSLRQLIQGDEKRQIETKVDLDQLKDKLTDAVKQISTEMANVEKHIQIIESAIQGQKQTTVNATETTARHIAGIQRDIDDLKQYLDKLPSTSPVLESIAKLEDKMTNYFDTDPTADIKRYLETVTTELAVNENPAPSYLLSGTKGQSINNEDHTSNLDYSTTNQEQEESRQPDLRLWPAITEFVTVYEHFKERYRSEKIENEPQFIETFLSEMNVHASCALQRHLLDLYPKKVALIPLAVGQQSPSIFIGLSHMRWNIIRRAVPKINDLKSLQFAINEGISGPTQAQISRQEIPPPPRTPRRITNS